MAQEPLAKKGNFSTSTTSSPRRDARTNSSGCSRSSTIRRATRCTSPQPSVKDGVPCRDTENSAALLPDRRVGRHRRARPYPKDLAEEIKPAFVGLIEGRKFVLKYVEVVSSTPEEILNAAQE